MKIKAFILLICLVFLSATACCAQDTGQKCFQGVEILTGFGWGKLKGQRNYNLAPLSAAFDFNLKNVTSKN